MKSQNVLVIGTWHLGSVIGTCLAESRQNVHLWDQNPQVSERWQRGAPPIHEPGLEEIVKKHWGQNLFWTEDLKASAQQAQWIVIAYDTAINDEDEIILSTVEEGFKAVLDAGFSPSANFFITSQVPIGTSRKFRKKILQANPQWKGHLYYQPENLRLGEAIKSFRTPDRMVLGIDSLDAAEKTELTSAFREFVQNPTTPVNVMSLESAEMVKHALNSFLATCVVFANELSEICERFKADAWDVVASLKQDSRVGPKAFLRPGLGFAGGTLARDVKTLSHLAEKSESSNFFTQLYKLNQMRNGWVLDQLKKHLKDLAHKKIVLLGITYKPFTSTVRRSPALDIARLLVQQKATCVALDPMADMGEFSAHEKSKIPFELEKSTLEAFRGAHGAVVVTEWPQFKELKWAELKKVMSQFVIVDSKNLFQSGLPEGFTHVVPGKGDT